MRREYDGYNTGMEGGDGMHTVMESIMVAGVPPGSTGHTLPVRITTTLYELIEAIQEVVESQDDALVVATVAHILTSWKCSIGQASTEDTATNTRRYRV